MEVLAEGPSKSDITRQSGRTDDNRIVNFVGEPKPARMAKVLITHTKSFYLEGVEKNIEVAKTMELTPMMKQYLQIHEEVPDAIFIFRRATFTR